MTELISNAGDLIVKLNDESFAQTPLTQTVTEMNSFLQGNQKEKTTFETDKIIVEF